jgi:hypothetical protein
MANPPACLDIRDAVNAAGCCMMILMGSFVSVVSLVAMRVRDIGVLLAASSQDQPRLEEVGGTFSSSLSLSETSSTGPGTGNGGWGFASSSG